MNIRQADLAMLAKALGVSELELTIRMAETDAIPYVCHGEELWYVPDVGGYRPDNEEE